MREGNPQVQEVMMVPFLFDHYGLCLYHHRCRHSHWNFPYFLPYDHRSFFQHFS